MINLNEIMEPRWDRTRDPGSAVRLTFVARHVTDWAVWPGRRRIVTESMQPRVNCEVVTTNSHIFCKF